MGPDAHFLLPWVQPAWHRRKQGAEGLVTQQGHPPLAKGPCHAGKHFQLFSLGPQGRAMMSPPHLARSSPLHVLTPPAPNRTRAECSLGMALPLNRASKVCPPGGRLLLGPTEPGPEHWQQRSLEDSGCGLGGYDLCAQGPFGLVSVVVAPCWSALPLGLLEAKPEAPFAMNLGPQC